MAAGSAILEMTDARPTAAPGEARPPAVTLRLMPGELALIDARDADRAAWFADLCCGLLPLADGSVRFLGHDWAAMPAPYAAALRGRIGRVFAAGGWVEFLDTATNILLPQLHHTRDDPGELREAAAGLARGFGLPGLPTGPPGSLSATDLARAACVRAFLGDPALLLLETPVQGRFVELFVRLLNALARARQNGAAAIWLTASDLVWGDRSVPAAHRLRLRENGLIPVRRAA
ncbi:MAG TPA: ABC transporter ATP-binding protein [Methylomirabilota bacterium]|nr:ABC transporter ATP-binding protein [Methylomirabilota bacterium]